VTVSSTQRGAPTGKRITCGVAAGYDVAFDSSDSILVGALAAYGR